MRGIRTAGLGIRARASSGGGGSLPTQTVDAAGAGTQVVSFGMPFAQGALPSGQRLAASYSGGAVTVQTDVLTTHGDGSAKFADVTLVAPSGSNAIAFTTTTGSAGSAPSFAGHTATLSIGGNSHNLISGGTLVDNQRSGSTKGSMRRKIAITGQTYAYIMVDMEIRSDGSLVCDFQIRNNRALNSAAVGVTLSNVILTMNGTQKLNLASLDVPYWTCWGRRYVVDGSGTTLVEPNVVPSFTYLRSLGLIANYDQTMGPPSSLLTTTQSVIADSAVYDGAYSLMTMVSDISTPGDRAELGEVHEQQAAWLMTGHRDYWKFICRQAEQSYTMPFHYEESGGYYMRPSERPDVWVDSRDTTWAAGTPSTGASTAWQINSDNAAHLPHPVQIPYLATARRHFHDECLAQAGFAFFSIWTYYRGATPLNLSTGSGYMVGAEERAHAWALLAIGWAAWAATDATDASEWDDVVAGNIARLVNYYKANSDANQGVCSGIQIKPAHPPGETRFDPWQQDYIALVHCRIYEMGWTDILPILNWRCDALTTWMSQGATFPWEDTIRYEVGFCTWDGSAFTFATTWAGLWTMARARDPDSNLDTPRWSTISSGLPIAPRWRLASLAAYHGALPAKRTTLASIIATIEGSDCPHIAKADFQGTLRTSIVRSGVTRA